MEKIKSILLDIPQDLTDMTESHVDVLWQCIESTTALTSKFSGQLTLFSHVFAAGAALDTWLQGTVLHNARDELVKAQEVKLNDFAAKLKSKGMNAQIKVIWGKHFDEAMDLAFPDEKPDLIVQPSRHHLFAASVVRQPNEWRLIRYPGIPVILQQQTGPLTGKVLLALDVGEVDTDQKNNVQLIQQMKEWCQNAGSELHLLNAFPSAADLMAFAPAEWTIPQIQSTLEKQHRERLVAIAEETGIPGEHVHVGEGQVAQVMDECAAKNKIDLVAIASHCRTGVSGFFIGNTAEVVLEHTRLNMLVIKPVHE